MMNIMKIGLLGMCSVNVFGLRILEQSSITFNDEDSEDTVLQQIMKDGRSLVDQSEWYQKNHGRYSRHQTKFLRPEFNIKNAFEFAKTLELTPPTSRKHTMDLGSGPGWFAWVLQKLGHDAHGIEPLSTFTSEPMRNMTKILGVPVIDYAITPFKALPSPADGEKYDVITSWLACFDGSCGSMAKSAEGDGLWGKQEWEFILKDMACNQLKPDGRFVLQQQLIVKTLASALTKDVLDEAGVVVKIVQTNASGGHYQIFSNMSGLCSTK
eukprot:gnl/MRDRNA2_/MRDRNA2_73930_c0_seq1.p1 gnl/MRDRNA2_/MRDRNA2_73930_c0~~gnl/MRDRNA2_/MRDRNA2_73930_c0_seq1.p1  ORF type:complete len:268 (-),score=46.34 gnl/MRDRNA2_/MRDRNA2_73930_c0_seq1:84-887(-)